MTQIPAVAPGDPAPYFTQRSPKNERFRFDVAAGRFLVLVMIGSAGAGHGEAAIREVERQSALFDDTRISLFFVSSDPQDEATGRLRTQTPGRRIFWDFDRRIEKLYGANRWVIIDPTMRVRDVIPFAADQSDIGEALARMAALPDPALYAGFPVQAPILVLPSVFEPALCDHLVALYDAEGREASGFMLQIDGKTVPAHDKSHKVRRDYLVEDPKLVAHIQQLFLRRIVPEILKVHQFRVTRMERYLVGCYAADEGGHFRAHRDNTTSGTAHRRFAVSINLNDDFEGGEVGFPEYGPRSFKAPKGGAVVFSCSLLHAVSPVTAGKRYAFLPFLYDDAAAKIREANNKHLAPEVGAYRG
jgi:predicted 2-oxoglutarate/Fe(II)-dependent dioxygenase YbiX